MTKGFVKQQALKEKGGEKKRMELLFLLLCRQGQQWLQPYEHVSPGIGSLRGMSAETPGARSVLAQM